MFSAFCIVHAYIPSMREQLNITAESVVSLVIVSYREVTMR